MLLMIHNYENIQLIIVANLQFITVSVTLVLSMAGLWKVFLNTDTPIYNTSILVTKKPVSGIYIFGHFLIRLSEYERS